MVGIELRGGTRSVKTDPGPRFYGHPHAVHCGTAWVVIAGRDSGAPHSLMHPLGNPLARIRASSFLETGIPVAAMLCMLAVLVVVAVFWVGVGLAACALCAAGGAADERREEWYREHTRASADTDHSDRGAA